MPCYHPQVLNPPGRRSIKIACRQCIGCRVDHSRMWAIRCVHEKQFHADTCAITLTYDDEHLPVGGTLVKKHFQDFIGRFRHRVGNKISYFHAGEYGDQLGRPHYHALIFGADLPDKKFNKKAKDGSRLYTSEALDSIWTHGRTVVGDVTYTSAAYVARYIMKKITGDLAPGWYQRFDPSTGEIFDLLPEYCTMSTRPAIGKRWMEKYGADVFPDDYVIFEGKKHRVPRYYDKLLKRKEAETHADIKKSRFKQALKKEIVANNRPARLAVRETVKLAQVSSLKRNG